MPAIRPPQLAGEPSCLGASDTPLSTHQDVARLVVERSTIMSHLFSKLSPSAASDAVLSALLSIFSRYVRRMRQSKEGEEVYSWVRPRSAFGADLVPLALAQGPRTSRP